MKNSWLSYPYMFWMVLFITLPLLLIIYYAFTVTTDEGVRFSLHHAREMMDPLYLRVLWRSLRIAFFSMMICLFIGYPVAYILASRDFPQKAVFLMLIVIPMWMNFLLRTYAWLTLLERNGIFNQILGVFNIEPIQFLYNEGAVILGMVYNFLPFMILPVYSVLIKIDLSVIEASQDLGANWFTVIWRVIFPLSIPGVVSGITMVFMPAVSTFVIPRLLGGGQFYLVGNVIEQQFLLTGNRGLGSILSLVLLIMVVTSMFFMNRNESDQTKESVF